MSAVANTRYNFSGNTVDEIGGSYYVVTDDRRLAGPFASGPYALTVRDRLADEWNEPRVVYEC